MSIDTRAAAAPPVAPARRGWRRWSGWFETAALFAAYEAYEWARAQVQGRSGPSLHHALQIVRIEQWLGIFQEARIQNWVLPHHLVIQFWDLWYGTVHFILPPVALYLLYHRCPDRYRHHRDALIVLSLLGLACFWLWSLTPPRLLPAAFHFTDTASTIGGMGAADRGRMADDNLYAAMPSLHIAWSTWSAVVLVRILKPRWAKLLAAFYPVLTLIAVTVTANHFFLDGVGGVVFLAAGWLIAIPIERVLRRNRPATAAGNS